MSLYGTALKDANQAKTLSGLLSTYEGAAETTLGKCGAGFAQTGLVSAAADSRVVPASISMAVLGGSVVASLSLMLGGWSF